MEADGAEPATIGSFPLQLGSRVASHWKAAGLPWITGHVLRYQCITKMAEVGIDRVTAKRIAGHDKMWDKYSQVRIDITAGPGSVYGISALRSRVEQSTINMKNPEGDDYPLWLFGVMM